MSKTRGYGINYKETALSVVVLSYLVWSIFYISDIKAERQAYLEGQCRTLEVMNQYFKGDMTLYDRCVLKDSMISIFEIYELSDLETP